MSWYVSTVDAPSGHRSSAVRRLYGKLCCDMLSGMRRFSQRLRNSHHVNSFLSLKIATTNLYSSVFLVFYEILFNIRDYLWHNGNVRPLAVGTQKDFQRSRSPAAINICRASLKSVHAGGYAYYYQTRMALN